MILITGQFSGGTTMVAKMVAALGFEMGQCSRHQEHFEMARLCRRVFLEPSMTAAVSKESMVKLLRSWRDRYPKVQAVKHPTLTLMVEQASETWADDLHVVRIHRPVTDTVNSLARRGWHKNRPRDRWVRTKAIAAVLPPKDALELDYNSVIASPRTEARRLADYLETSCTEGCESTPRRNM